MRSLLALVALGAMAVTGCGGGSSSVRAPDGVLRIDLDEYRIVPAKLTVPAGRIRLSVTNSGRLTHNLAIESLHPKPGVEPHIYGRTNTLHPDQHGSERRPFRLKPGRYRLTCTIANHDDLGQYGELDVVAR